MPAAKERQIMEDGAELAQCVYRVAELPVVAAVFGGVAGVYERVKQSPVPLVGRTLNAAEATVKIVADRAYPVALKFERPIGYIDQWACKGLDMLEDNVPIVKKAPEAIMADAKAYFSETAQAPVNMVTRVKSAAAAKVEAATDYGRDKVIQAAKNAYAQRALQNLDAALTTVDSYVDKYIPGEENEDDAGFEEEENWDPALSSFAHAAALTNKIRRRIYKLTLAKAQAASKKCTDALDNVPKNPTDFVDYVRLQLTTGSQALTEATNKIWKETAAITPGRAAEAVTAGLNVIEARTAEAARVLLQYLKLGYNSKAVDENEKPE